MAARSKHTTPASSGSRAGSEDAPGGSARDETSAPAREADPSGLGARVRRARRAAFVGRREERALFASMLAGRASVAVLQVHGPAGTGKSALVAEFAAMAADAGRPVFAVDGRDVAPTPDGVLGALRAQGPWPDHGAPTGAVVLVDDAEELRSLDGWIRERFIAGLPADALLVLAGRTAPPAAWRADAGLSAITHSLALRNLTPAESRDYLARRHVPATHHEAMVSATYGHPLALALFADLVAQGGSVPGPDLAGQPALVQMLAERFVAAVPSPRHRDALDVCALARVTTESLLGGVLEGEVRELFDWLRGLAFMAPADHGVRPHDVARDVLDAHLRWRDPDRHAALRQRLRAHALRASGAVRDLQRSVFDWLFLHKRSAFMRPYFDFLALERVHVERAAPADHAAILAILARHEGDASAAVAQAWLARQPEAFQVWRTPEGGVQGVMAHVRLDAGHDETLRFDPAMITIGRHLREAGALRPGECALVHRFWADRDGYQDRASQTVVAGAASLLWTTMPRLAWAFPCTADPDRWAPMFAYCRFSREPALDFEVGGRTYGVFAHDWRAEPLPAWLDVVDRGEPGSTEAARGPAPLLVLSRPDFEDAVRHAFRDLGRPDGLAANPLTRSKLLAAGRAGDAPAALRALLLDAVEALRGTPKDEKLYRALWHTYCQPADSQELVAERLGLPFSTYRYHLRGGIARVVEALWQREIAGGSTAL